MTRGFLIQYLQTNSFPSCQCYQQLMETINEYSKQEMINLESIKRLLEPIPPDLIIICEDHETLHTHKLLVGLASDFLAKIFLEADFLGEIVTLFIPEKFQTLKKAIFTLDNEGLNIFLNAFFYVKPIPSDSKTVKFNSLIFKGEGDHPKELEGVKEETETDEIGTCHIETGNNEGESHAENTETTVLIPIKKNKSSYIKKTDIVYAPRRDEERIECPFCSKRIRNCKLESHKKCCQSRFGKRRKNRDICSICTKSIRVDNIVPHMVACRQKQEEPEKKKVNCPICHNNVDRPTFIWMHYYKCSNWTIPGSTKKRLIYESKMDSQNALLEEPATCSDCGKTFFTEFKWNCHLRYHQKDKTKTFHCDKCEFTTTYKSYLKDHIESCHTTAKYVTCDLCGTTVKDNQGKGLHQHMKLKHTIQEMVQCGECGKDFKKCNFKKHVQKVHGERKYACHLCSYKAQSKYNLKLHISKSHLGLKEIPKEKCQYCEVETTNMPLHMKQHHPEI